MPGLRGVVEYRSWSSGRLSAPWAIRRTIRRVRGTDSYPVGNRMARGLCSSYRGGEVPTNALLRGLRLRVAFHGGKDCVSMFLYGDWRPVRLD